MTLWLKPLFCEDVGGHAEAMTLGFGGEVAEFYQRYRRGYPATVFEALVDTLMLTDRDTAIDLGCGTGQLTIPLATHLRAVVGVDPEADMLVRARQGAADQGVTNVSWMLGADTDVAAVGELLGLGTVGAVTIGQALHWMDHQTLFRTVASVLRPGGGVAIVTNGAPLWLHDAPWSRALRGCLEQWFGAELSQTCGTDEASQRHYSDGLVSAGYAVSETSIDYTDDLTFDQLVGGVYSAFHVDELPAPDKRSVFADQIRRAVHGQTRFPEPVHVAILIGRTK